MCGWVAMAPQACTSAAAADAASRTAIAAATILARSTPAASSPLPAPHLLLRYLDRAIASTEYAQASLLLSSPSSSPSSSPIHPPLAYIPHSPGTKQKSDRKVKPEISAASDGEAAAQTDDVLTEGSATDWIASDASALTNIQDPTTPGAASRQYDLRLADEAYRAGSASLSQGNIKKSLKLLQLASSNCPPDRPSAVAKIRRLIKIASQQLQRKQTNNGQTISPDT